MNKKLKVLKGFRHSGDEYKENEIIEVAADLAKELIEKGLCEVVKGLEIQGDDEGGEADKGGEGNEADGIAEQIAKAVSKAFDRIGPAIKRQGPRVEVTKSEEENLLFKSFGEQLQAVANPGHGINKKRLEAVNKVSNPTGLNEQVDNEGGYLVQPEFAAGVDAEQFAAGEILSLCETITLGVNSNQLVWNAVDDSTRVDGSRRGGISVHWTHEAAARTATKPDFETRRMLLEKQTGLYYATDELLQDAPALAASVNGWFGEEMQFDLEDQIINGSGSGQPLGILNSPALVSVAEEGSQGADTIMAANLYKMYMRQKNPAAAVWTMNNDCWAQLFSLASTGDTRPIFLAPGGDITQAPNGLLFGRPIIVSEVAQTIGDKGDIMFNDYSNYRVIVKGGIEQASSIHVKFVEGETAFRFTRRVNGQPRQRAAITPKNGSTTISSFVCLDARAG